MDELSSEFDGQLRYGIVNGEDASSDAICRFKTEHSQADPGQFCSSSEARDSCAYDSNVPVFHAPAATGRGPFRVSCFDAAVSFPPRNSLLSRGSAFQETPER